MFPGETEVIHVGFPDPAKATGTEEEVIDTFRQVRDDLRRQLIPFLKEKLGQEKFREARNVTRLD